MIWGIAGCLAMAASFGLLVLACRPVRPKTWAAEVRGTVAAQTARFRAAELEAEAFAPMEEPRQRPELFVLASWLDDEAMLEYLPHPVTRVDGRPPGIRTCSPADTSFLPYHWSA